MSWIIRKVLPLPIPVLGLALCTVLPAPGQQHPARDHGASADIAITYVAERAKIASVDCGCFWLQGGSSDFAVTFFRGLGVAANLTGVHAANIGTGLELDQVMFAMGPRYTFSPKRLHMVRNHEFAIFGEGLFGGVHGFDTAFPSSAGVHGAASSFAQQYGGGVDFRLARHIGIRAVEADYIRSTLPNGAGSAQNDLRLAAGISFHFNQID